MANYTNNQSVIKVARIGTVPFSHRANQNMYRLLTEMGIELTIVCSRDTGFDNIKYWNVKDVYEVPIAREIAPFSDLVSVCKIILFLKKKRPHIVHSSTPKGGLVCALAAFISKVPVRVHTYTGQRWATLRGVRRRILIACEWLVGRLSTHLYADSPSQVSYLIQHGVVARNKIKCLGLGSFGGVDVKRFAPQKSLGGEIAKFGILPDDVVFVFVGRINRDKGMNELAEAFSKLLQIVGNAKLLLVGPFEQEIDPVSEKTFYFFNNDPNVICVGFVEKPEQYLAAANVMVFPSYREGFPTVVLEAAAMEVPTIGTDIVGGRDTIQDGKTGMLIPSHDSKALLDKMLWAYNNPNLLREMGKAARQWVCANFEVKKFSKLQLEAYKHMMVSSKNNK